MGGGGGSGVVNRGAKWVEKDNEKRGGGVRSQFRDVIREARLRTRRVGAITFWGPQEELAGSAVCLLATWGEFWGR